MPTKTLEEILRDVGAYVDQDTATPTGTELTVRVNFVNQALKEWSDTYDWSELNKPGTISVGLSATSAALPVTFKKLLSPLIDASQPVTKDREYIQIPENEQWQRQRTDKVIWVGGDESDGYYIGSFGFVSGFSGVYNFQSHPSSLATLADSVQMRNPAYLTKRTIAYVLEARSDARFPQAKQEAEVEMRRMIEFEDTPTGGEDNRIPDWARSSGFVIGEE